MESGTSHRLSPGTSHQTNDSTDAREFVESVMSSQRVSRVETPAHSGRKRHLSVPSSADSTAKKARVTATARRTLYTSPTHSTTSAATGADSEMHSNASPSIEVMIKTLSADMHMMFSALTERVDKLESGLEVRISNKVAQLLDKRVNSELNKIKKDVDTKLDSFKDSLKEEMSAEIAELNLKLQNVTTSSATYSASVQPNRALNVVIRNLPASNNENVIAKVNAVIKDGLRISDVKCSAAERKRSFNDSKPGVIIASFGCHDDKRKIMQKKKLLKDKRQYDRVFIEHDLAQSDRIMNNNFRTILGALREQNLTIRGSRVVNINHDQGNAGGRARNGEGHNGRENRDNAADSVRPNTRDGSRDQGTWQTVNGGSQRHGGRRGGHGAGRQSQYRRS